MVLSGLEDMNQTLNDYERALVAQDIMTSNPDALTNMQYQLRVSNNNITKNITWVIFFLQCKLLVLCGENFIS